MEKLYKEIQPRVFAFFLMKTSDKELAEDLTHEVFYKALRGLGAFHESSTIQTWIFGIARKTLYQYYRSNQYKQRLTEKLIHEGSQIHDSLEHMVIKLESTQYLAEQIQALEPQLNEIVLLRVYGELSFKEIGQLLDKTENHARVLFHRAKLKLHQQLEGYYEG